MKLAITCSIVAAFAAAATDEERRLYPEFDQVVSQWGYTWESFLVSTGDGKWDLPLFHITGTIAEGPFAWSAGNTFNEETDFFPSLF